MRILDVLFLEKEVCLHNNPYVLQGTHMKCGIASVLFFYDAGCLDRVPDRLCLLSLLSVFQVADVKKKGKMKTRGGGSRRMEEPQFS